MITEIPTTREFHEAGVNQLYLAWQISIQTVQDYEQVQEMAEHLADEGERQEAAAQYWAKSQPALANAFGLIQQAMEMALKGRIAAISPFLLISRDPKDWPSGADRRPVPFSEFRTLDAADLVKVHNSFAALPLDEDFRIFWDEVRRDRNRIMHSISAKSFDPALLVRTMMEAIAVLFDEQSWPGRLKTMELDGRYAAYGLRDDSQNVVMGQVDIALRYLSSSEKLRFFGFNARRRAYLCPSCYNQADTKWQDDWPRLAQLTDRAPSCRSLRCVICTDTMAVERRPCTYAGCPGNVIHEGLCLTCLGGQDDIRGFSSGLEVLDGGGEDYDLRFGEAYRSEQFTCAFGCDEDAREHGRRAMLDVRFAHFESATVRHRGRMNLSEGYRPGGLVGTWYRAQGTLTWDGDTEPPPFDL